MTPKRLHAFLLLLLATSIWAFAAIVIKFTLQGISPFSFLFYRFFISSIFALASIYMFGSKLPKSMSLRVMIVVHGLLSTTFALGFLFLGLNQTTVLNLSLITLALPLLASIAGVIFLKEKITKREKIGIAVALAGTAITLVGPIIESGIATGTFWGNLMLILHITFDIAAIVVLKKLLKKDVSPTAITNYGFLVGFVSFIPIILFNFRFFIAEVAALSPIYHLGVLYMALFSGNIAYLFRSRAQKIIEVSEASLFSYLIPVLSVPLAVILLREELTLGFVVGAIIVIIGVIIAETRSH